MERLHHEKEHVLIVGGKGLGKSALINHLKKRLGFLVCSQSEHLGFILEQLESGLGLPEDHLRLIPRKRRVLNALAEAKYVVVFDGVSWTTPRLNSFLESVIERVPIWLSTRSEYYWDIGHFWTWLVRFKKVELEPFRLAETRELITTAVQAGKISRDTLQIAEWLHRHSKGNPRILRELFEELNAHSYDLTSPLALRRLELDRRIHEIFPEAMAKKEEARGD